VKITQADQIKELNDLLELAVGGTVAIWELESSGIWRRDSKNRDGEALIDMQDEVMARTLLKKGAR
jgi:polyphosphate kinase